MFQEERRQLLCLSASLRATASPTSVPVGRQEELKRLEAFLEKCRSEGQGSALYVCGQPGTGKTCCVQYCAQKMISRWCDPDRAGRKGDDDQAVAGGGKQNKEAEGGPPTQQTQNEKRPRKSPRLQSPPGVPQQQQHTQQPTQTKSISSSSVSQNNSNPKAKVSFKAPRLAAAAARAAAGEEENEQMSGEGGELKKTTKKETDRDGDGQSGRESSREEKRKRELAKVPANRSSSAQGYAYVNAMESGAAGRDPCLAILEAVASLLSLTPAQSRKLLSSLKKEGGGQPVSLGDGKRIGRFTAAFSVLQEVQAEQRRGRKEMEEEEEGALLKLLVVDEIDVLVERREGVSTNKGKRGGEKGSSSFYLDASGFLTGLFDLSTGEHSKLVLIGIANSSDLFSNLRTSVVGCLREEAEGERDRSSREGKEEDLEEEKGEETSRKRKRIPRQRRQLETETLIFPPYTAATLKEICTKRILTAAECHSISTSTLHSPAQGRRKEEWQEGKEGQKSGSSSPSLLHTLFADGALELTARKEASRKGDCREMLSLCEQAVRARLGSLSSASLAEGQRQPGSSSPPSSAPSKSGRGREIVDPVKGSPPGDKHAEGEKERERRSGKETGPEDRMSIPSLPFGSATTTTVPPSARPSQCPVSVSSPLSSAASPLSSFPSEVSFSPSQNNKRGGGMLMKESLEKEKGREESEREAKRPKKQNSSPAAAAAGVEMGDVLGVFRERCQSDWALLKGRISALPQQQKFAVWALCKSLDGPSPQAGGKGKEGEEERDDTKTKGEMGVTALHQRYTTECSKRQLPHVSGISAFRDLLTCLEQSGLIDIRESQGQKGKRQGGFLSSCSSSSSSSAATGSLCAPFANGGMVRKRGAGSLSLSLPLSLALAQRGGGALVAPAFPADLVRKVLQELSSLLS
uniref:Uncharacterized protein n=1 Tax=Chromera velia CCMP2878 TaxID=1169474 RepID=A0A0G4FSE9_9ALVE|eukprot:Cvel_18532.t1-p1 / transcript=Cvel_18532.t1 / gene=Cvel_18532 / organism=Chromera_velia_CCMP2878 / gene_product=hypothetical protein / transcript_product=hypothetical protein / location=Cvel_scaffold1541:22057-27264(-) / protein_length=917 / sequence_SO=supercontig / SO=protein_coding / is_pseudo=false